MALKKFVRSKNIESQKLCSSVSVAMEIAVVIYIYLPQTQQDQGKVEVEGWGVTKHKFTLVLYCFVMY